MTIVQSIFFKMCSKNIYLNVLSKPTHFGHGNLFKMDQILKINSFKKMFLNRILHPCYVYKYNVTS